MAFDPDLAFVVGLGLVLLSLLSFAAAWVDRRRPWLGAVVCAAGLGLVALAFARSPVPYDLRALPMVIFTVLGRYVI